MARIEQEYIEVEQDLTDVEILQAAYNLPVLKREVDRYLTVKKRVTKICSERLNKIKIPYDNCIEMLLEKKETRNIECKVVYNWTMGQKEWYSIETGEMLQHGKIPDNEKQEDCIGTIKKH